MESKGPAVDEDGISTLEDVSQTVLFILDETKMSNATAQKALSDAHEAYIK